MRVAALLLGALALGALGTVGAAGLTPEDAEAPSRREQQKLVDEFLEQDAWTPEGVQRRAAILDALDAVPPLRSSEVKSWTKRIEKAWKDGPTLEKSSGIAYLYPDAEPAQARGKYVVGGDTGKPKGLLIAMHGGGVGSGDAEPMAAGYDGPASKRDLLMIAPEVLEKTERGWTDSGTEEFVIQLVERALRTWKIDPERVYFSGHSMGGYGSWTLGAHHADLLAGAAPSAGGPTPIMDMNGDFYDIVEGIVPNLRNLRVCCYQSADDVQVPPGPNRIATQKIEEAQERWGGFDYEYWEVDGRGHGAPPGGYDALLDKVIEARRNTRPERIVWQPTLPWKRDFYWLRWETPERYALLVVDLVEGANEVRIESNGAELRGFSIYFDEEMVDLDEEVVVLVDDVEVFRGILEPSLTALLSSAGRGDAGYLFAHRVLLD